jgi:hypothetical protein
MRRQGRFKQLLAMGLAGLLAGSFGVHARADTETGNLPGGTSIEVSIDSPSDGAVMAGPTADVPVTGTAAVGQGVPFADTALVYVIDASASTDFASNPGCGGDQNGDAHLDRVLDCEILAARTLNQDAVAKGTVGEVGVVAFADLGASGDVGPAAGDQIITGPATDSNSANGADVEEVLTSAFSGAGGGRLERFTLKSVSSSTNFEAGVQRACDVAAASTKLNKIVLFMSDGVASTGGNAIDDLPCASPATFHTFAVGSSSSCDLDNSGLGSLRGIAEATGGTCTQVTEVTQLPSLVPSVIGSSITQLTMTVDGGLPQDITTASSPTLPQAGPASVSYGPVSVNGLTVGTHTICVTTHGSDGGGNGSVTDCHSVSVVEVAPPDDGCTLTQGYWSTHSERGPASLHETWVKLSSGADTPFFGSGESYYDALWKAARGNAYWILAAQYIAAELNGLNSADLSAVQSQFDEATNLFASYSLAEVTAMTHADPVRQRFIELSDALDDFNNGVTGPGHCDDLESQQQ